MTDKHLTDTEIQRFVLEEKECDVCIVEHIKHCAQCAIKTQEYRMLFEGIEQQKKSGFNFSLADLIFEQIPQLQPKDSFDKLFSYIVILVVVFFVSMVFYLFKDALMNLEWKMSPASTGLIITTVACIAIFLFTDMYRKYQKQMHAVNFIK